MSNEKTPSLSNVAQTEERGQNVHDRLVAIDERFSQIEEKFNTRLNTMFDELRYLIVSNSQSSSSTSNEASVSTAIEPSTAAIGTSSSKNDACKKPDTYEGDPEHLETFITRLSTFLEVKNVTAEKKVQTAITYLDDIALDWWRMYRSTLNQNPDFDTFINELRRTFEDINVRQSARDELYELRQEKVGFEKYIKQFRKLIIKLGKLTEEDKIDKLMRGLIPRIACEIRKSKSHKHRTSNLYCQIR